VISRIFRVACRWIFFAALIYAPWAYGATTSASIQVTDWILLAALVLWIVELLLSGRRPRFQKFMVFLTGALICLGGWMVFNAKSIYDSDFFVFVPLRNFAPPLSGSVDYAISGAWMIRGALLLGVMWFVADLSQSDRWLLRLWYVIGLAGGSIAFLGLLQKDDFLATAPAAAGSANQHFFCDILLPRQRWRILEPGVAIECGSCYPGV